MRIYYIDESEGPRYYVRSALGVNAERWNGLHGRVQDWRTALAGDYRVPTSRELHACDLLAGRGKLARIDNTGRRLTPVQGAEIFMNGLRIIESAANRPGGIEVSAWSGGSTAGSGAATPCPAGTRPGRTARRRRTSP